MLARAFIVVSAGKARRGKVSRLRVGLNNFGRLCNTGAVSSCLVPCPGVIRAEEHWPLV